MRNEAAPLIPHSSSLVPRDWLPEAPVKRVIMHWSAGGHQPSVIDRCHYHLLIDAAGKLHRGQFRIGRWPPHTRRLNTGSVGIAVCGMLGADREPLFWGRQPITNAQIAALSLVAAQVLAHYGLPVTEATCLTHCEVTTAYGIVQRGKWDISVLPGMRACAPHSVGEHLRQLIRLHWRALPRK
jgi:hypothetical protein